MIIITGAAGFIGSNFISKLNDEGIKDIVIVDDFSNNLKNRNIEHKSFLCKIDREQFFKWFNENWRQVEFIAHIGARTDTAESDKKVFDRLNLGYSRMVWNYCVKYNIPLIYASSAATYGLGEHGFADDHELVERLKPLNLYGESKNEFDKWVLKQKATPPYWTGIKFFNVYGPNEYHKGRMASVILHAYNQLSKTGRIKLFRSHNAGYKDGEQKRDFIYIKDILDALFFLMNNRKGSGIYNLGTGTARTFLDLAENIFKAAGKEKNIEFIDTPEDIREKYQYFTEAEMNKLRLAGYSKEFTPVESGIEEYVNFYLTGMKYN
ncbi:MAG: ADP-glyceromanno-heptose 6-epimerase [Bacteroidales bacterium]|nr:MAG: ADP-glyceromanno-heptose 6-epimerase [Bacteroidales bacterium]